MTTSWMLRVLEDMFFKTCPHGHKNIQLGAPAIATRTSPRP